jgi:hypothetical protein
MAKHTHLFLLIIFTVHLFYSCKKESHAGYNFTEITATDANGTSTGTTDTTDWGYDTNWSTAETKLLSFKDTVKANDTATGYVQLSPVFPNPSTGIILMGVDVEKACKMKAVLVNKQFQILHYLSRPFTGGPILTAYDFTSLTAFRRGNYYRMYYGFYNANDSLYYKGHGDILIE